MPTEELGKKVELAWLLDFYGGMLTEKQREVLALHCEEDLSLGEIAGEAGISRQGVHDMLTRAAAKLFDMEARLGIARRFSRIQDGLEDVRQSLKQQEYQQAAQQVELLIRLNQEDNNGL